MMSETDPRLAPPPRLTLRVITDSDVDDEAPRYLVGNDGSIHGPQKVPCARMDAVYYVLAPPLDRTELARRIHDAICDTNNPDVTRARIETAIAAVLADFGV